MARNKEDSIEELGKLVSLLKEYTPKLEKMNREVESFAAEVRAKQYDLDGQNQGIASKHTYNRFNSYLELMMKLAGEASHFLDLVSISPMQAMELELRITDFEYEVKKLQQALRRIQIHIL